MIINANVDGSNYNDINKIAVGGKEVNLTATVNLQNKTVTANGDVTPDTGYDALSKVVVNVPQPTGNINITGTSSVDVTNYATAQVVDANLIPSNIKKDVTILGKTGTYESGGGSSLPTTTLTYDLTETNDATIKYTDRNGTLKTVQQGSSGSDTILLNTMVYVEYDYYYVCECYGDFTYTGLTPIYDDTGGTGDWMAQVTGTASITIVDGEEEEEDDEPEYDEE